MPRGLGVAAGCGAAPESRGSIHGRFPPRRRCSLHRKLTALEKRLASNLTTTEGLSPPKPNQNVWDAEGFSSPNPNGRRSFPEKKKKKSRRCYSVRRSSSGSDAGWFGLAASPTSRNARLLPLSSGRLVGGAEMAGGEWTLAPSVSSVSSQDGVRRGVRSRRSFPLISPNG